MRDGFAGVFGGAGELEGFWSVEGCGETDFADFFGVALWFGLVDFRRDAVGKRGWRIWEGWGMDVRL